MKAAVCPTVPELPHDLFAAARGFLRGDIEVPRDLVETVRAYLTEVHHGWKDRVLRALVRMHPWRVVDRLQSRTGTAADVRFHYERSPEFFRQFLGARLVYSCAYYEDPGCSLERAQAAKLDHICRKLDLRPADRFLDIGCGWGALVQHAAGAWGVRATGCTLTRSQAEFAEQAIAEAGLSDLASVQELDYRSVIGRFDKIASVGMFEHVGRGRLRQYFLKVASVLEPGGLFLNHGITSPEPEHHDEQSWFIRRCVFPGGEIVHLSEEIAAAEDAGFEILDVESMSPHYALTCRAWIQRLLDNSAECERIAGRETYRTWLLFLAGSAVAFEQGWLGIHQVLMGRRGVHAAHSLTRRYMYCS
jgi:cyclopropane-fatty-acyl-phospholipid synthase